MKIVCNIILILTVCISVVYSYIQRNEYEDRLWTLNSLLIENKNELFNIKEKLSTELKLEGYILDDSITSIIPPYTLILRLHNNVCLSCYTDILLKLKSELEKKNQDLFILGSYTFESNLKKEISIIQCTTQKYANIPTLVIPPADSIETPYLFFLDNKGRIVHPHILIKKDFQTTYQYLQHIKRIYPPYK